jgi:hypothetical protein
MAQLFRLAGASSRGESPIWRAGLDVNCSRFGKWPRCSTVPWQARSTRNYRRRDNLG